MNNDKSAIQVIAGAARCPEYSPSMVKALMKKLETNEKAFALMMNVTTSTPLDNGRGQSLQHGPEADADL